MYRYRAAVIGILSVCLISSGLFRIRAEKSFYAQEAAGSAVSEDGMKERQPAADGSCGAETLPVPDEEEKHGTAGADPGAGIMPPESGPAAESESQGAQPGAGSGQSGSSPAESGNQGAQPGAGSIQSESGPAEGDGSPGADPGTGNVQSESGSAGESESPETDPAEGSGDPGGSGIQDGEHSGPGDPGSSPGETDPPLPEEGGKQTEPAAGPVGDLPQTETQEDLLFVTEYTVRVKNAAVLIPEGGRIYDGTERVDLTFETEISREEIPLKGDLAERKPGSLSGKSAASLSEEALKRALHRAGEADPAVPYIRVLSEASLDSPDAGERKVKAVFRIETDEPERVVLDRASLPEKLTVEVLPKTLSLSVSDGVKTFSDPADADHIRLTGSSAISVSGFVKDAAGRELIPADFSCPLVEVDPSVLNRWSPIYEGGRVRQYEGALVLQKKADGTLTGCAGANYRFPVDGSAAGYRPGTVTIVPECPEKGKDYEITGEEGAFSEEGDGSFLVRKGSSLTARPLPGSGYTDGERSGPLMEDGVFSFRLRAVDAAGALAADSMEVSVPYRVDSSVPEAGFLLPGSGNREEIRFSRASIPVRISVPGDPGSGLEQIRIRILAGSLLSPDDALEGGNWSVIRSGESRVIETEGKYLLEAETRDRVGNRSLSRSPVLVIDRTAPDLEIRGVGDGSANAGELKIEIAASDPFLKNDSLLVSLVPSSGGRIPRFRRTDREGQTVTYAFDDFPHTKEADAFYTLRARVSDLAGNVSSRTVSFSVNRFGSVYVRQESLQKELRTFYHREPFDVTFREMNLDEVGEARILLKKGDTLTELRRGNGFQTSRGRADDNSRIYTYTVPSSAFLEDGIYEVMLLTKDAAGNTTDSQAQKEPVRFAIDRTAPEFFITGLVPLARYQLPSLTAVAEVRDNLALSSADIFLNGQKTDHYSAEMLKKNHGILKFTLDEKEQWQRLQLRVIDEAGNESWSEEYPVYISMREDLEKVENYVPVLPEARELESRRKRTAEGDMRDPEEEARGAVSDHPETEAEKKKPESESENDSALLPEDDALLNGQGEGDASLKEGTGPMTEGREAERKTLLFRREETAPVKEAAERVRKGAAERAQEGTSPGSLLFLFPAAAGTPALLYLLRRRNRGNAGGRKP